MKKTSGFTLLEFLIATGVLSAIMWAIASLLNSSLSSARTLDATSDLLGDAQLAQQIVVSRAQQALYVYPSGTDLSLGGTWDTRNTVRDQAPDQAQSWRVGTDPILALVLPPAAGDDRFRLVAYYAMRRDAYLANAGALVNPGADPALDGTWVILEHRASFAKGVTAAEVNADTSYRDASDASTRLFLDGVTPLAPGALNGMFRYDAAGRTVTFRVRVQRRRDGRVLSVPGAGAAPLEVNVSLRN